MPAIIYNSFAGGMNASGTNPRLTPMDCCPLIVNGTVRGGFIDPRPAIVRSDIAWLDTTAQQVFQRGVYQGSSFYNSENGPVMLFAFDGHLVSYNIIARAARCLTMARQPFSRHSPFVFFGQRGPYAVAQDGVSPPVIIRGTVATQGTAATGVPCGTFMADGWGRFFVVSPDRTRIYASNHEADPTSPGILAFTEGTAYYLNAPFFAVPANLGKVMAMEFAPSYAQKSDLGPLTLFCEFGTRAFDVSVPRDQWITTDIATTPMPSHGACAHGAVVRRGNEIIFSDQDGHIQTMMAAMRRDQSARVRMRDASMYPVYRDEFAELRRWRQAVHFNDRTLTTVLPRRVRRDDGRCSVVHDALAVEQETPQATNEEVVWDGLWTGLGFASLDMATVQGRPRCFTVSNDTDGVNRLYEITGLNTGTDVGSCASPIPMTAQLRAADFDTVFLSKKFEKCAIRLGDVSRSVTVTGWWSKDRQTAVPWFTAQAKVVTGKNSPGADPSQPLARMNPPAPPKAQDKFFEMQPMFTITGAARLEEVAFETGNTLPVPNKINTGGACQPQKLTADATCPPNPFTYAIPA